MQKIDKNIEIEDLVKLIPESVVYLMEKGIRCLRCGEPIWGTLESAAKEKGFTFPYLMDKGQKIYPQYGATKTPHIYILEKTKKGNEVKYIGGIDDNYKDAALVNTKYVENAVDALLDGKEVPETNTRAIGCSIKV